MDQDGKSLYDKVLDESDLSKKEAIQHKNKRRYENNRSSECVQYSYFPVKQYGVKLDDEDKTIKLLCSFPKSWDHLVISISFSTTETLEFDTVVGALLWRCG